MKRIAILGSGDALKPKIIIETLVEMNLLLDRELVLFTDKDSGICTDYCKEQGIEVIVFSNTKLDDSVSAKVALDAKTDILISAGWPYKVPIGFLQLFKFNPVNCHGSILPDYRGSRAYMHYWANCEDYYGATIHYMNEKFDDGKIIVQGRLKSFPEETPIMMHRRTAELCAYLLPTALMLIEKGYVGKQINGLKRYFSKLSPEEFEQYRAYNVNRSVSDRKLTPHKIL